MKKEQVFLVLYVVALLFFGTSQAFSQIHPKMYFYDSDIGSLQIKATNQLPDIKNQIIQYANSKVGGPLPSQTRDAMELREYGDDLIAFAFAYVLTDDIAYLDLATSWMMEFAAWQYWDETPDIRGLGLFHMIIGNSLAYDWLYLDLTVNERTTIKNSLATQAEKLYQACISSYNSSWANWWNNSYMQNHAIIAWSSMGVAGLVLDGEIAQAVTYQQAAENAWVRIKAVINLKQDASWHESTQYGGYAFNNALIFLHNYRRLKSVDLIPHSFFNNYTDWRIYNFIPGTIQLAVPIGNFEWDWNDPYSPHILRFCANEYNNANAQWLADYIVNFIPRTSSLYNAHYAALEFLNYNTSIQPLSFQSFDMVKTFNDADAVVWRSGWDEGDMVFSFKTGAYGGRAAYESWLDDDYPWDPWPSWGLSPQLNVGHDHDDQHSFVMHYNGVWVAPENTGNGNGSTSDHNSILIDNIGQRRPQDANYNNYPDSGPVSDGTLEKVWTYYGQFYYLAADGLNRYKYTGSGFDLTDMQTVKRYIIRHDDQTVIIVDHLKGTDPHTYQWQTYLNPALDRSSDITQTTDGWTQASLEHDSQTTTLWIQNPRYQECTDTIEYQAGSYNCLVSKNTSATTEFVHIHLLHATTELTGEGRPEIENLNVSENFAEFEVSLSTGSPRTSYYLCLKETSKPLVKSGWFSADIIAGGLLATWWRGDGRPGNTAAFGVKELRNEVWNNILAHLWNPEEVFYTFYYYIF